MLKNLLLQDIDNFLSLLGEDITYVKKNYLISKQEYIDVLLYSIKKNSYIVVQIKNDELNKEYLEEIKKSMHYIDKKVKESFDRLKEAAKRNNYLIDIESGYRDYDYQEKLYNKLLDEKGFNYTVTRIARPGSSEHQTGLAIDFCVYQNEKSYIEHEIEDLIETKWVHQNCHKYGFILRYPEGKEDITKYSYEPWHLRFVGDIAPYIYNNNLTLEEYKERKSI